MKNVLELTVNSRTVLEHSRTVLELTVSSRTFFAGDALQVHRVLKIIMEDIDVDS